MSSIDSWRAPAIRRWVRGTPGGEGAEPLLSPRGWLPLLSRPDQMRLLGPLEAEGFLDLEEQWRELLAGNDGDTR